jgi:hypothetical protein
MPVQGGVSAMPSGRGAGPSWALEGTGSDAATSTAVMSSRRDRMGPPPVMPTRPLLVVPFAARAHAPCDVVA